MSGRDLSKSGFLEETARYAKWAPDAYASFGAFANKTFEDGALSKKDKEIIAVACAHVLRCPYCIDYHIKLATDAGATREEIVESIWVGIGMGAGACFAHAAIAMRSLDAGSESGYYVDDGGQALNTFALEAPSSYGTYASFKHETMKSATLAAEFKELIAVACAHNTRCAFCIDHHVEQALAANWGREAIAEAIWVAIEMGAGACFGHAGLSAALLQKEE